MHALVVNAQAFPSRDCFKHAFVTNTQALTSRDCFEHALVVNAHAFPSRDSFKHVLVVKSQAFPSRKATMGVTAAHWSLFLREKDVADPSLTHVVAKKKHSHHHPVVEF